MVLCRQIKFKLDPYAARWQHRKIKNSIDLIITVVHPSTGLTIFKYTASNFAEMLAVIPPIFLFLGLLDVWVPRETIIRYLGEGSGLKGVVLSIVLGAAAAGPLYGAFP